MTHPEAKLVTGIDVTTDQPAWTIETEGEPRGVSAEPGGGRLHIAQRKPAGTAIIELAASGNLSAPYFHNGSEPNLGRLLREVQRFDRMGFTSHLSGQDIKDLTALLNTL